MRSFTYRRVDSLLEAVAAAARSGSRLIAGGTELLNWLKDGMATADELVDVNGLPGLSGIEVREGDGDGGLRVGALARMSDVAASEAVRRGWPALAEALEASASPQLRNMASMGGNLLQRTRCPYFRAEVELPCNKRRPGSGCAAWAGEDRSMAVFGWSEQCLATHPSDAAVALAALDAVVEVEGPEGARSVPMVDFHRLPGETPERDTVLTPGEVVTAIAVPASPLARHSRYLKVRERASYEFALVSAAAGVDLDGERIATAAVALGGVAAKPWRLGRDAEAALTGVPVGDAAALRAALEPAFASARPRRHNAFKVELARRAAVRALQLAGGAR